jgi:uncharacterized repeat protein (TIGR03847 family)
VKRRVHDFDAPDRFAAGMVGGPDEEVVIVQAVRGTRTISVALERDQLAMLADRTVVILDELERRGLVAIDAAGASPVDAHTLDEPVIEAFRAGTLTIGWDDDGDRLVIEAIAMAVDAGAGESVPPPGEGFDDEVPDDEPIGPDVLRVRLTPVMAQRFARSAGRLASSG